MKVNFRFSNLIGTVYRKGNIAFLNDTTIISPVGNKVTIYDLKNHKSDTLPVESESNIRVVALSPNSGAALFFNETGECSYVNLATRTIIHTHYFRVNVSDAKFSPDGKYFVVCKDTSAVLFRAPCVRTMQYNPFYEESTYRVAHDTTTCVAWSSDSKFFAVGASDTQVRVCAVERYKNFRICNLSGHTGPIVACFFVGGKYDLYSIDQNGKIVIWEWIYDIQLLEPLDVDVDEIPIPNVHTVVKKDDPAEKSYVYKKATKFSYRDLVPDRSVTLMSASFHSNTGLIASGFSDGSFFLHEMPEFNLIHSLSIAQQAVSSITLNSSGDWIGVACAGIGQLLVWEWQSETYVMKQQGHSYDMTNVAYSPDGLYVATGGQDGKLKVWTLNNGFCFVTFDDHTGSVTGIAWTQAGRAVISSSLDGSVRAFDMKRYRNFRTFVAPQPVQFSCVCVDGAGDVVCAGGQDVFDIYVWSMQTGKLLEVLSGHEAPVSSLRFNPAHAVLASCSWDKTLRIWDVFEGKGGREIISLNSDGLCVQFSPDGKAVACATLDAQITLFDWREATQIGNIECQLDLDPGRGEFDEITAAKATKSKCFSTFCFSADGEYIVAGGQSRYICIYNVERQLVVKKFLVTSNKSLDKIADDIDRRKVSDYGYIGSINVSDDEEQTDRTRKKSKIPLPGVRVSDLGERQYKPEFRVYGLHFSPTGRSWAACTTEGLLIYSLDQALLFNPYELERDVTPAKISEALSNEQYGEAVIMAIKLNQAATVEDVIEKTPTDLIEFVCRALPVVYAEKLLNFLSSGIDSSRHVEFYLIWIHRLLLHHGGELKIRSGENMAVLTALQHSLSKKQREISKICEYNRYGLEYILSVQSQKNVKIEPQEINEDETSGENNTREEETEDFLMDVSS